MVKVVRTMSKDVPVEVFEEVPVDQYVENKVEQFPEALPENLSLERYQKLLNDSRFFGEQGVKVEQPKNLLDILMQHKDKRKALKGINEDMPKKNAYPNYDEFMSYPPPRDTTKWVNAVKDMYYRVHKGLEKSVALQNVIAGWDEMEKLEFKNWLRYYEGNTHKKYSEASEKPALQMKVGQVGYWEDINRAGYFVPVHQDPPAVKALQPRIQDMDIAKDPSTNEGVQSDERREVIEAQRNKIVSRLDSAEKLLRSQEGQIFAGKEFETLMHIIYELKKKIHTVNKISTATKLYEDMIVREGNILAKKGFLRASEVLFKIAEGQMPGATPPAGPSTGAGNPGAIPGGGPGMDPAPSNPPTGDTPPEGMTEFLDGLEGDQDNHQSNDLEVHETDDTLTVEAQLAPEQPAAPAPPEQNLEVEEQPEDPGATPAPQTSNFDQKAEQAFADLKVEDVVQKLEDVTKYYKNREMPRQLAWIDMMLDKLGLAPFFPSLAEATNNALASNQYVLTRLEEITSRLRGTVQTNDIDLKGQNPVSSSPELEAARKKLQQDADNEKNRKQMKKEQDAAQLAGAGAPKPEPELEVAEDLGGPVATPAAPAPEAPQPPAPIR